MFEIFNNWIKIIQNYKQLIKVKNDFDPANP